MVEKARPNQNARGRLTCPVVPKYAAGLGNRWTQNWARESPSCPRVAPETCSSEPRALTSGQTLGRGEASHDTLACRWVTLTASGYPWETSPVATRALRAVLYGPAPWSMTTRFAMSRPPAPASTAKRQAEELQPTMVQKPSANLSAVGSSPWERSSGGGVPPGVPWAFGISRGAPLSEGSSLAASLEKAQEPDGQRNGYSERRPQVRNTRPRAPQRKRKLGVASSCLRGHVVREGKVRSGCLCPLTLRAREAPPYREGQARDDDPLGIRGPVGAVNAVQAD